MQSYLILPRFIQHVKLSHDKNQGRQPLQRQDVNASWLLNSGIISLKQQQAEDIGSGLVADSFNPSVQEAEAGGSPGVQVLPGMIKIPKLAKDTQGDPVSKQQQQQQQQQTI